MNLTPKQHKLVQRSSSGTSVTKIISVAVNIFVSALKQHLLSPRGAIIGANCQNSGDQFKKDSSVCTGSADDLGGGSYWRLWGLTGFGASLKGFIATWGRTSLTNYYYVSHKTNEQPVQTYNLIQISLRNTVSSLINASLHLSCSSRGREGHRIGRLVNRCLQAKYPKPRIHRSDVKHLSMEETACMNGCG